LRITRPININAPTIKTNPITSDVVAAAVESIVAAVMKVMIQASQMDNERGGFMTQVLPEFARRPVSPLIEIDAFPPMASV